MNFKGKNVGNYGITLVGLIVTIIILLIFVGVALSLIVGEDGVIGNAIKASNEMQKAQIIEDINLIIADYSIERNISNKNFAEFLEYNKNIIQDDIIEYSEANCTFYKKDNYCCLIDSNTLEILSVALTKNEREIRTGSNTVAYFMNDIINESMYVIFCKQTAGAENAGIITNGSAATDIFFKENKNNVSTIILDNSIDALDYRRVFKLF